MTFEQRLNSYAKQTEDFLDEYLNTTGCVGQEKIVEAMRYSALAGGKRLRPALTWNFAVYRAEMQNACFHLPPRLK